MKSHATKKILLQGKVKADGLYVFYKVQLSHLDSSPNVESESCISNHGLSCTKSSFIVIVVPSLFPSTCGTID